MSVMRPGATGVHALGWVGCGGCVLIRTYCAIAKESSHLGQVWSPREGKHRGARAVPERQERLGG